VPYLLFCTDEVIPPRKMPDHCRVVPVNSDSIGAALMEACRLMSDGVIVWKLQGADAFRMERSDIEIECLIERVSRHHSVGPRRLRLRRRERYSVYPTPR
jgi:hypothetical protein